MFPLPGSIISACWELSVQVVMFHSPLKTGLLVGGNEDKGLRPSLTNYSPSSVLTKQREDRPSIQYKSTSPFCETAPFN